MGRPRGWEALGRWAGTAHRAGDVLQLRRGHRNGLEVHAGPRADPLARTFWDRQSPDREAKERSPWGWLFYRRVKTGKAFYRPMNRVVNAHLRNIMPDEPRPDAPVFLGGGARPNARFQALCDRRHQAEAGHRDRQEEPWELKDLRKTCATYYDEHVPESSVEILGHSVGGITYRHYAHRAPLAFRAIMTLPNRPRSRLS